LLQNRENHGFDKSSHANLNSFLFGDKFTSLEKQEHILWCFLWYPCELEGKMKMKCEHKYKKVQWIEQLWSEYRPVTWYHL
jgi:hypothetical protein